MSYKITWLDRGVYVRYRGRTSIDEVRQYGRIAQADARFDELSFAFNDFRACTGMEFDSSRVEDLAASDRGASLTNPNIWIVVLTDNAEVEAFVAAYLAVGLQAFPVEVFKAAEDALACVNRVLRRNAKSGSARSLAELLQTPPL
jgi:hypothetical protein